MRFLRSKDTTRTVDWDTYQRVLTERDTARKDAETWRTNFQTVNRRLAGEQAANERLDGRNRRLTEQLEQARDTAERLRRETPSTPGKQPTDDPVVLRRRIARLRRACDRYRRALHGEQLLSRRLAKQLDDATTPCYVAQKIT